MGHDERTSFRVKILDVGPMDSYTPKGKDRKMQFFSVTAGAEETKVTLRVYMLQFHKMLKTGASYLVKQVSFRSTVISTQFSS